MSADDWHDAIGYAAALCVAVAALFVVVFAPSVLAICIAAGCGAEIPGWAKAMAAAIALAACGGVLHWAGKP